MVFCYFFFYSFLLTRMTSSDSTPATKGDLKQFMQVIMTAIQDIESRMATKDDLKGFATKDDLRRFATKDDVHKAIQTSEERVLLFMEHMRHDIFDAYNDRFSQHDDRLRKLESHAGIA